MDNNTANHGDGVPSGRFLSENDLWRRSEPRSLVNLVSEHTAQLFIEASRARPELFGHDERTLLRILKALKAPPTPTDNRLRLSFWMEYDRAQMNVTQMSLSNVYAGVCGEPYFYHNYLNSPAKVAWLVCQPASYEKYADEAIVFGLEQLRDVLEIPHVEYDEIGNIKKVDTKLVELKAKIVFGLEARRKGAVVQRVEQKNMNLSITATDKQVAQAAMSGTMEDLERRLEDIRKRQRKARAEIEDLSEAVDAKEVASEVTPGSTDA